MYRYTWPNMHLKDYVNTVLHFDFSSKGLKWGYKERRSRHLGANTQLAPFVIYNLSKIMHQGQAFVFWVIYGLSHFCLIPYCPAHSTSQHSTGSSDELQCTCRAVPGVKTAAWSHTSRHTISFGRSGLQLRNNRLLIWSLNCNLSQTVTET